MIFFASKYAIFVQTVNISSTYPIDKRSTLVHVMDLAPIVTGHRAKFREKATIK